jgi:hypothetical protein
LPGIGQRQSNNETILALDVCPAGTEARAFLLIFLKGR